MLGRPEQVCAVAFSKKDMGPQRFLGLDKTIYKNATETRAPARGRYPRLRNCKKRAQAVAGAVLLRSTAVQPPREQLETVKTLAINRSPRTAAEQVAEAAPIRELHRPSVRR